MDTPMFFDTWYGLLRVIIVGALAYVLLVALLRISGKRTLTKLNAFDLVVTVALGSTLATVLLSNSVPLAEGVLALALLTFLQFALTWLSVRSRRFSSLIKSEPTLVMRGGRFLDGALKAQRVSRDEVLAVLRAAGVADRQEAAAVVLETDGSFSVLTGCSAERSTATLVNVERNSAPSAPAGRQSEQGTTDGPIRLAPCAARSARPTTRRARACCWIGRDPRIWRVVASGRRDTARVGHAPRRADRGEKSGTFFSNPPFSPPSTDHLNTRRGSPVVMYSIFYIIGVIVVVLAILSLLGLA